MSHPDPSFEPSNCYPDDGFIAAKMTALHTKQLNMLENIVPKSKPLSPLAEGWCKGESVTNFPK